MEIMLALTLPRDEVTVPLARHVVRTAMERAGVEAACADDVVLALSEACTNVLLHAGAGDEYEVRFHLGGQRCQIRVVDLGRGFDSVAMGRQRPQPEAERGRGLTLMRALVDRVRFTSRPEDGTVVTMEKELEFADPALLGDGGDAQAPARNQV
jgi:serine/threonine-protein kinase RsbW